MQPDRLSQYLWGTSFDFADLCSASQFLMIYGGLMWLACGITYVLSLSDPRTLREVGVWVKPMKFMAATGLFVWTTVWVSELANSPFTHTHRYLEITALIVITSLFEVAYITYQASQGAASHYNNSDPWHSFMFGLMAIAAVGLTASQGWLAWEIWESSDKAQLSVKTWGGITGLTLTFILSTISGFLLGGNQPPAGLGLPIVGWHLYQDIRPSHFVGVHAQQFIPLLGILADRLFSTYSMQALAVSCSLYAILWGYLTWRGLLIAP